MVHALAHHRAHHAEVVGALTDIRKQVADGQPALTAVLELPGRFHQAAGLAGRECQRLFDRQRLAVVRIQVGLRIKGVDRGRPAVHEQKDHPLGARREHGRLGGQWIDGSLGPRHIRHQRLQPHIAKAASRRAQHPAARKLAILRRLGQERTDVHFLRALLINKDEFVRSHQRVCETGPRLLFVNLVPLLPEAGHVSQPLVDFVGVRMPVQHL